MAEHPADRQTGVLRVYVMVDPVKDGKFIYPGQQANWSECIYDGKLSDKQHADSRDVFQALLTALGVV